MLKQAAAAFGVAAAGAGGQAALADAKFENDGRKPDKRGALGGLVPVLGLVLTWAGFIIGGPGLGQLDEMSEKANAQKAGGRRR